jgi:hypothetical protein
LSAAHPVWRAVIEIVLLIFFFYSARSMGESTATNGRGKSIVFALKDIHTGTNFLIATNSALIGCFVFESVISPD